MKKLVFIITGLTALAAALGFLFYFFKVNPEFCPRKKKEDF